MSGKSKIEWTDATWNPVRGCSKVSEGCRNCYAMRQAHRTSGKGGAYEGLTEIINGRPQWNGKIRLVPELLAAPLHWKKPRRIFVNSMSDLFHEDVPDEFIDQVFAMMSLCPQHIFQVLTKRPERMQRWISNSSVNVRTIARINVFRGTCGVMAARSVDTCFEPTAKFRWPLLNIWLGVSVEDQLTADERIPLLLQTPAAVRFISAEPLLGPIQLTGICSIPACFNALLVGRYPRLNWVITGGESGPGARPSHPDWFRSLRDQCAVVGVPFFFKQWDEWVPCETEVLSEPPGRVVYPLDESITLDRKGTYKLTEVHSLEFVRVGKKAAGRLLDGRTHDEYPA